MQADMLAVIRAVMRAALSVDWMAVRMAVGTAALSASLLADKKVVVLVA